MMDVIEFYDYVIISAYCVSLVVFVSHLTLIFILYNKNLHNGGLCLQLFFALPNRRNKNARIVTMRVIFCLSVINLYPDL